MRPTDFGQAWPVTLEGASLSLTLQPWRYGQHIAALRQCVQNQGGQLQLDADAFADCVLAQSGIEPAKHPQLREQALWWAAGGDASLPDANSLPGSAPNSAPNCAPGSVPGIAQDGSDQAARNAASPVPLGSCQARLQPWRERERMAALLACLGESPEGEQRFDVASYLDSMTRASLQQLEPPIPLEQLDARATRLLLAAVVACNVAEPVLDPSPASRISALRTLRICQALGWTPSQVWAAPAAEIDQLLTLLEQSQPSIQAAAIPAPAPARSRPSMAERPDAIVIMIDQEEPQHA